MAGSLNKVLLVGRLGQDPTLSYTQGGTPVCSLGLATDESYKNQSGDKVEKTEWHRIVCWGKTGELVANYLRKGSLILVEGKLQTRKWTDKEGVERYSTEVHVNNVQFLESKKDRDAAAAPPPPPPSGPGGPAFPAGGYDDQAPF